MAKPFRACAGVCGGYVAACLILTQRLTAVMLVTVARDSRILDIQFSGQLAQNVPNSSFLFGETFGQLQSIIFERGAQAVLNLAPVI